MEDPFSDSADSARHVSADWTAQQVLALKSDGEKMHRWRRMISRVALRFSFENAR
jgi:hypothetical protein